MEILFLLIPLAVGLMIVAVVFFLWTVKSGQYDDMEGPAHRILMDDDDPLIPRYGKDIDNDQEDRDKHESDNTDRQERG
jgi:cbb3-type cytochrome oxidase maturation protein